MASSDQHKRSIGDWALFGGPPAFAEPVHVGRPNIGNRLRLNSRINDLLDRRWLSNKGPLVEEFERRIAQFLGVRHCVATCNGTVAIEIAIRALELSGEVIVPSFTFVATAHALQWHQITPVFCDIDPFTHALDPAAVKRLITPRTSGILGVHVWGEPCAVENLTSIAQDHGLKLMFDASHAFGCAHRGTMIGNFGEAEVFSFHATKYFNTFEGGAVATNSDKLAERVRLMKNFGFAGYDTVISLGTNGKMTEVCAAMGLTNLESLADFKGINRRNYARYCRNLEGVAGVRIFPVQEAEERNYQYVVAELDAAAAGIARDLLVTLLHAENVLVRRYFYPGCHNMEPYRSSATAVRQSLPATEDVCSRVLVLPTGTAVEEADIDIICSLVHSAIALAPEIALKMRDFRS